VKSYRSNALIAIPGITPYSKACSDKIIFQNERVQYICNLNKHPFLFTQSNSILPIVFAQLRDHINHRALYKYSLKQTEHTVVSLVFDYQADNN
jgi:hypothetical protein